MNTLSIEEQEMKSDNEHLDLLAIFHYVYAGISGLGILFLIGHYSMMRFVFVNVEREQAAEAERVSDLDNGAQQVGQAVEPIPEFIEPVMNAIYLGMGFLLLIYVVALIFTGVFIKRRTHRIFTIVMAGVNCLNVPIGTALGVFTIVKLTSSSVRGLYED